MDVLSSAPGLRGRAYYAGLLLAAVAACGDDAQGGDADRGDDGTGAESGSGAQSGTGAENGSAGAGGSAVPNPDGDCLSDEEEAELGTDPTLADTDGDGVGDCEEVGCVSDPLDGAEKCYACGWKHADPGNLVSTGSDEGDVIANFDLVDQCNEPVKLWDFAGEYHILFMTASW